MKIKINKKELNESLLILGDVALDLYKISISNDDVISDEIDEVMKLVKVMVKKVGDYKNE